jgi:hypothetical protein
MKICGTEVRPPAFAVISWRSSRLPSTSISSKATPFFVSSALAAWQ